MTSIRPHSEEVTELGPESRSVDHTALALNMLPPFQVILKGLHSWVVEVNLQWR